MNKLVKVKMKSLSRVRLFATLRTVVYQASPSMGFPGKSTGVGCRFLLQGIFLTQGSNPGLLHYRQILYHLSHQGSPKPTALDIPRQSSIQVLVRPTLLSFQDQMRSDAFRVVLPSLSYQGTPITVKAQTIPSTTVLTKS